MNTEILKQKLHEIFGNKYDFSKVIYSKHHVNVCVICPKHGEFWATPHNLLKGRGCPKCAGKYKTTEDVINEFKEIHGDKYDYSKVIYTKAKEKVCIICPIHGEFWQSPNKHLSGNGCPLCAGKGITNEELKRRCKEIHGDKILLNKANYISAKEKIIATCPIHGDFETTPDNLLRGHGCPKCKKSILEEDIKKILTDNNIEFIWQCTSKTLDWLELQSFDFYLPQYSIAIECQGEQHFKAIDFFGGYNGFTNRLRLDKQKYDKSKENGIKILYYTNIKKKPQNYFDRVYNKNELLKMLNDLVNSK